MAVGSFVLKSLHLEGAVSHQIKYGDAVHVYFENWASFDLEGLGIWQYAVTGCNRMAQGSGSFYLACFGSRGAGLQVLFPPLV